MSATEITAISTSKASSSVGPYSQGIRAGGFLFCAGQAAFDPETGHLVEGGITEQTRQVLRNLQESWKQGEAVSIASSRSRCSCLTGSTSRR